jgi:predicted RNase H-like HicB family nuclease
VAVNLNGQLFGELTASSRSDTFPPGDTENQHGGIEVKSYTFKVAIEEDTFPDGSMGYFVAVPALEHPGAATQGKTREEAMQNIQEVLHLILEELLVEGKSIQRAAVTVSEEPLVTVTL